MPKIKTSKTAAKRLAKITSSGRPVRRKMLSQHLARRKSRRTVKASGDDAFFSPSEAKKIIKLNPYRKR